MYYAYLARCADKTLYSGYTNDIKNREVVHNSGEGARYTRGRGPVKIIYFEEFKNRSAAMKRECEIKRMKRAQKEALMGDQ